MAGLYWKPRANRVGQRHFHYLKLNQFVDSSDIMLKQQQRLLMSVLIVSWVVGGWLVS